MKTIKQHLKTVGLLLVLLMLLQVCTVYNGKSVSLDRELAEVSKAEQVTDIYVTHALTNLGR